MSGYIAVIYSGDLGHVANAFAEAASQIATETRTARLLDHADIAAAVEAGADFSLLEWANGIAFGTPSHTLQPDPALMRFLQGSEPLWTNGRLYDKAVTVFTDEPERRAPDAILHPIYEALYRWGAVIIGPRDFDLTLLPTLSSRDVGTAAMTGVRLRAAQYRAHRLARFASVLCEERSRRAELQL